MSSMNDVSGMPQEGKNLIVVADVSQSLHFRIFDSDGKRVVDTDEKSLTAKVQQFEDLKSQLKGLWPPHPLTGNEKNLLITAVTSILGHTRGRSGGRGQTRGGRGPGEVETGGRGQTRFLVFKGGRGHREVGVRPNF
jgi:hypothetical protein